MQGSMILVPTSVRMHPTAKQRQSVYKSDSVNLLVVTSVGVTRCLEPLGGFLGKSCSPIEKVLRFKTMEQKKNDVPKPHIEDICISRTPTLI